jgi:hypothetical protein
VTPAAIDQTLTKKIDRLPRVLEPERAEAPFVEA